MKNLLTSAPLLTTAAAISAVIIVALLNLNIVTPNTLGLGAGIATCAGLLAMLARDFESKSCC